MGKKRKTQWQAIHLPTALPTATPAAHHRPQPPPTLRHLLVWEIITLLLVTRLWATLQWAPHHLLLLLMSLHLRIFLILVLEHHLVTVNTLPLLLAIKKL